MQRSLSLCALALTLLFAGLASAQVPQPSPYPVSWELKFTHGRPQRVVVELPGHNPSAWWYMTYTVTNQSDRELIFLPVFEMLTSDGQVIRSDKNIPLPVFEAICQREGNRFLEQTTQLAGEIRLGDEQSRDGVAIWPEPMKEMGNFSIFVGGLSGEAVTIPGPDDKPVILRKTLQLNYLVRGDDVYPGEDEVNENPEQWVMR